MPVGVFQLNGGAWVLWHVAPSLATGRQVRDALRSFTKDQFYAFEDRYVVRDPYPILGERRDGRRVTWGASDTEWHAWQVRDAIARVLGDRLRKGLPVNIQPEQVWYRRPDGRLVYTHETGARSV